MKKQWILEVAVAVVMFVVGCMLVAVPNSQKVLAQSIGATPTPATQLSGCPTPAKSFMNFCQVTGDPANPTGVYVTADGLPYFLIAKAPGGGGVSSFNTRTGAVASAPGDYSFSQLNGAIAPATQFPLSISCTISAVVSGSQQQVTLSGCK